MLKVTGIEQHNVLNPVAWHGLQHLVIEISVWIDQADSMAVVDVLGEHVQQERGLSRASCPENIAVVSSISSWKANFFADVVMPDSSK